MHSKIDSRTETTITTGHTGSDGSWGVYNDYRAGNWNGIEYLTHIVQDGQKIPNGGGIMLIQGFTNEVPTVVAPRI